MPASGSVRQRRGVLAGQLREARAHPVHQPGRPAKVGGRVRHPGDVGMPGQFPHCLVGHGDDRPPRYVIDDHRDGDGIGNGVVVKLQTLLGRLVVVGGDHQQGIRPRRLGVAREIHRFRRRVGAGPGDHRHAARGLVDADFYDSLVLVVAEGGRFPRRADGDQAGGAFLDLPAHQTAERILIHPVTVERGDQGGA